MVGVPNHEAADCLIEALFPALFPGFDRKAMVSFKAFFVDDVL